MTCKKTRKRTDTQGRVSDFVNFLVHIKVFGDVDKENMSRFYIVYSNNKYAFIYIIRGELIYIHSTILIIINIIKLN